MVWAPLAAGWLLPRRAGSCSQFVAGKKQREGETRCADAEAKSTEAFTYVEVQLVAPFTLADTQERLTPGPLDLTYLKETKVYRCVRLGLIGWLGRFWLG